MFIKSDPKCMLNFMEKSHEQFLMLSYQIWCSYCLEVLTKKASAGPGDIPFYNRTDCAPTSNLVILLRLRALCINIYKLVSTLVYHLLCMALWVTDLRLETWQSTQNVEEYRQPASGGCYTYGYSKSIW